MVFRTEDGIVVPAVTADQMRQIVRGLAADLDAGNGGLMLGPTHVLEPEVPESIQLLEHMGETELLLIHERSPALTLRLTAARR